MGALFETLPLRPGEDLQLLYRARSAGELLFRDELEAIAARRGARIRYVLGEGRQRLSAAELLRMVPDLAGRDVFVCGPPGLMTAVRAELRSAGCRPSSSTRSASASDPVAQLGTGSGSVRGAPSSRARTTAVTDSAHSSPTRTTIWNRAAATALAPPSRAPTNAPGKVTNPTVLVWSMAGTRASAAASRAIGSTACRGVAPSASHPSTSSRRARSPASRRRPVRVAAVIVPPTTIPETATRVRTERSRIGMPTISPTVSTAPQPQATTTATAEPCSSRSRRPAVHTATPNMTARTRTTNGGCVKTPRSASATNASWTTARPEAIRTARRWATRATPSTVTAMASRTTSPRPTRTHSPIRADGNRLAGPARPGRRPTGHRPPVPDWAVHGFGHPRRRPTLRSPVRASAVPTRRPGTRTPFEHPGEPDELHHHGRRHADLLQGLGERAARRLQPRLAVDLRRLGPAAQAGRRCRVPGDRARPARRRSLLAAVAGQRPDHLRRRPGRAGPAARPARRRPGRALHRRRRGDPLHGPARHRTGGQSGAAERHPPAHAPDRRQPRGPADRGVRRDPRRCCPRPVAVLQGPVRRLLRCEPPRLQRLAGQAGRVLAAVDDGRDQERLRLRQGLLRDGPDRGPQGHRRPCPDRARRRRPDRADPGSGPEVHRPGQGRPAQGLPRRSARPHRGPRAGVQRRSARLPGELTRHPTAREDRPCAPSRAGRRGKPWCPACAGSPCSPSRAAARRRPRPPRAAPPPPPPRPVRRRPPAPVRRRPATR